MKRKAPAASKRFEMSFSAAISKWCECRLSDRPGYYAGRAPSQSDLGDWHLEKLYQGIKADVGESEAEAFVDLVEQVKDMSATSFLVSFQAFFDRGFDATNVHQHKYGELTGRGDGLFVEGFALLADALSDRRTMAERNEDNDHLSFGIKFAFLMRHGRQVKRPERVSRYGPSIGRW